MILFVAFLPKPDVIFLFSYFSMKGLDAPELHGEIDPIRFCKFCKRARIAVFYLRGRPSPPQLLSDASITQKY